MSRNNYPTVLAYHAEIGIDTGDEILGLQVDVSDFMTDDEILHEVGRQLGVRTIGDIITELKNSKTVNSIIKGIKLNYKTNPSKFDRIYKTIDSVL